MTERSRIDRAERTIPASTEVVWTQLVDPARLVRWLPPKGARGEIHAFEARPGGAFRMTLHFAPGVAGKAGASRDEVEGRITEVEPHRLLAWEVEFPSDDPANAGTMTMRWELANLGSRTKVTVSALDPPAGIEAEVHRQALAASLEQLEAAAREP